MKNLSFVALAAATIAAGVQVAPAAAQRIAAYSTFQRSCEALDLEVDDNYVMLTAMCDNGYGRVVQSSIEVVGVQNYNGKLLPDINNMWGTSSFQRSCDRSWLEYNDDWVRLWSECRDRNGNLRPPSYVYVNYIDNIHGTLVRRDP